MEMRAKEIADDCQYCSIVRGCNLDKLRHSTKYISSRLQLRLDQIQRPFMQQQKQSLLLAIF
jgi:hypothetical protein